MRMRDDRRTALLKTILCVGVAAGLAMSHGTALARARATVSTTGGARWLPSGYNASQTVNSTGLATATATVSKSVSGFPFGGGPVSSSGTSTAVARDGLLQVLSENDVFVSHFPANTGNYNSGDGQGEALASWNDSITFFDPSLAVLAPVTIHASARLTGSVTTSAATAFSGGSAAMLVLGTGIGAGPNSFGTTDISCSHQWCEASINGKAPLGQSAMSVIPINISIRNGQTIGLSYSIAVDSQAGVCCLTGLSPDSTAISQADFSHTFAWGGVSGVTNDLTGAILSGYKLTSLDGFNYSISAIPEPSTWAMMIGGFGWMGCLCRRRRLLAS